MAHAVLHARHPMAGVDMHIPWPVGAPAPAPSAVPYFTFATLLGTEVTCLHAVTVFTERQPVMLRGTDIGPLSSHVGQPSLTLPLEIVTSGSKTHFGSSSIRLRDQHGGAGNAAGALLGVAGLNLNCGTPSPTLGSVIALTTVQMGMRLGDVMVGLAGMATDIMLQRMAARLGELGAKLAAGTVSAVGRRLGVVALGRVAARFAGQVGVRGTVGAAATAGRDAIERNLARVAEGVGLWAGNPLAFVIGSPLGPSISNVRGPDDQPIFPSLLDRATAPGERLGAATDAAVKAFLNNPCIPDLPIDPSVPIG